MVRVQPAGTRTPPLDTCWLSFYNASGLYHERKIVANTADISDLVLMSSNIHWGQNKGCVYLSLPTCYIKATSLSKDSNQQQQQRAKKVPVRGVSD